MTTVERLTEGRDGEWTPVDGGGGDKEAFELSGVQTWTDDGWTDLHRVIRHRAGKPMVRVLTHTGVVDVTADHSLLRWDGAPVSPRDARLGDLLLHADLPPRAGGSPGVMSPAEARIRGFFFGDGSCGAYDCPSGKKATWAINNSDLELLEEYKTLCEAAFPQYVWVIMPTLESSGVYKLSPRGGYGTVASLVGEFCASMYVGASKVIPEAVLGADEATRTAFWQGMYDADGDKAVVMRIDQKSQLSAACIFALAESLGYKASINTRADKPHIYRITVTKARQRYEARGVKKMYDITYPEDAYVYDLTTANHHFAAGVGKMVVHNTDSVMVIFALGEDKRHDLAAHFEVSQRVAADISRTFPSPIELEFEKCYYPYLLFSKKRYAGERPK